MRKKKNVRASAVEERKGSAAPGTAPVCKSTTRPFRDVHGPRAVHSECWSRKRRRNDRHEPDPRLNGLAKPCVLQGAAECGRSGGLTSLRKTRHRGLLRAKAEGATVYPLSAQHGGKCGLCATCVATAKIPGASGHKVPAANLAHRPKIFRISPTR